MANGVNLKPAFASTGFDERIRVMTDHTTRMYYLERQPEAIEPGDDQSL